MSDYRTIRPARVGSGGNPEQERDEFRLQAEAFRTLLARELAEWRDVPASLRTQIEAALKDN